MVKIDSFIIRKMANITLPWRGIAYFSLIMYVMVTVVYRVLGDVSLTPGLFSLAAIACYVYFAFGLLFNEERSDGVKSAHFYIRILYAVLFILSLLTLSPLAIASGFMSVFVLYAEAAHKENLPK